MSAIEAERELVEVVVQMLVADRALVRAEDPTLQKRSNSVHSRHEFVGEFFTSADVGNLVRVALGFDAVVAAPSVGVDYRPRLHGLADEWNQAAGGYVWDSPEADTPDASSILLHRDHHNALGLRLSPGYALFRAANVRLVDLDTPAETAPRRSHHCTPHLVEPGPGCLVAPQAQDTLETQGAPSELLIRHEPHSLKPRS